MLLIETLVFYVYLAALVTELWVFGSCFLLVFHLLPSLMVASSQVIGAMLIHSGFDDRNTFESCALIDPETMEGLLAIPLKWYALFNNSYFKNHAVHHAYPQLPLELINKHSDRYFDHILSNYEGVRYNRVLTHAIHGETLARLPAPTAFDKVVAFGMGLFVHFMVALATMGVPVPPPIFEQFIVDHRLFTQVTRRERMENRVRFMQTIDLPGRFAAEPDPNTYLRFYHRSYLGWKAWLDARGGLEGQTPKQTSPAAG